MILSLQSFFIYNYWPCSLVLGTFQLLHVLPFEFFLDSEPKVSETIQTVSWNIQITFYRFSFFFEVGKLDTKYRVERESG